MTKNITEERAARRFHQIATLEQQLQRVTRYLLEAHESVKGLKEQREDLIRRLRTAARDEGELLLFDLDEELT